MSLSLRAVEKMTENARASSLGLSMALLAAGASAAVERE
jgi:hypothetical protein